MSSITSAGAGLAVQFSGFAGSLTPASAPPRTPPARAEAGTATPSTVLTLNSMAAIDVVYPRPQALDESVRGQARAWASPQQDSIGALMARNGNASPRGGLADQWRGLGGALLSRFAATPTDYRQTMATVSASQRTQALDTQALDGVQNGAAKVGLTIKTRSGQTVELTIAANGGGTGGSRGLQVEVKSSGALSETERTALAQLAGGFDRALEGLGQPGKPRLDLSGLMDYDSGVLAGVDLTVSDPTPSQALSSFTLRLNAHQKTVAMQGEAGEIALNLDTATPLGTPPAQQRQAAIAQHLQQFDAAAERSRADAALVALFKDAFTQLHAASSGPAGPAHELGTTLTRQVQPLLSDLADFQASFGGDFEKTDERGAVKEIGRVDYQISQQTTTKRQGATGDFSVTQTQSERLDAQFMQARHGGMLDTGTGNYDLTRIKDRNTATTRLDTAQDLVASAVKTTEQQQLLTHQKLVNHRVEEERATPRDRCITQDLLGPLGPLGPLG